MHKLQLQYQNGFVNFHYKGVEKNQQINIIKRLVRQQLYNTLYLEEL